MDYEKAYKEAIKRAKAMIEVAEKEEVYKSAITIFPELKESEDERIRKALICGMYALKEQHKTCFASIPIDNAIAWLEKQSAKDKFIEKELGCIRGYREEALRRLQELEKQGLQNPSESSEEVELIPDIDKPKFAVGAYVTDDGETFFHIISYANNTYQLETVDGTSSHFHQEFIEKKYRLWSIEDAKDGDVIYLPNGNNEYYLFIFKGIENAAVMSFAHFYQYNDGTSVVEGTIDNLYSVNDVFQPANKEQRDLLFQKIKEAGYEWDSEKKKLKKINSYCQENCKGFQETGKCFTDGECKAKREAEHKSAWNEDDEEFLRRAINVTKDAYPMTAKWLKSLKDRVQPKQEWNEEDESYLNTTIAYLKDAKEFKKSAENCINWLKSLRPQNRWKPSDKQLKALKNAIHLNPFENPSDSILWGLYEQLKKLK